MGCLSGCCLALLAVIAPPIPVLFRRGVGSSLLLCCLLCILGWIPGIFYAWYVIASSKSNTDRLRTKDLEMQKGGRSYPHASGRVADAPPRAGHGPPPATTAGQGAHHPPHHQQTGHLI